MFAAKAVAIWQSVDEAQRPRVVAAYLQAAGGFDEPTLEEHRPVRGWRGEGDPLWVVVALRSRAVGD